MWTPILNLLGGFRAFAILRTCYRRQQRYLSLPDSILPLLIQRLAVDIERYGVFTQRLSFSITLNTRRSYRVVVLFQLR